MKKTCANGHVFEKSSDCPTCPVCECAKQHNPDLPKLGGPAHRALERAGVRSVSDLADWSATELLALHGVGPTTIPRLQEALKKNGLSLRKK
ncbi:MAG: helix-hairpin-helix domain-containing protein [Spirochaetota bacterium]